MSAVVSPFTPFGAEQISDDGTIAFAQVNFDNDIDETEATAIGEEISRDCCPMSTAFGSSSAAPRSASSSRPSLS